MFRDPNGTAADLPWYRREAINPSGCLEYTMVRMECIHVTAPGQVDVEIGVVARAGQEWLGTAHAKHKISHFIYHLSREKEDSLRLPVGVLTINIGMLPI